MRFHSSFGSNRCRVWLLAYETWLPLVGFFPVTKQTLAKTISFAVPHKRRFSTVVAGASTHPQAGKGSW